MLPERIECRVDPEPAGRKVVGDLEQRLELFDGALQLTDKQIDAYELVLNIGAHNTAATEGNELRSMLALANRFRLFSQIGQREPEQGVQLGILRRRQQLLLIGQPGRIGICARHRASPRMA